MRAPAIFLRTAETAIFYAVVPPLGVVAFLATATAVSGSFDGHVVEMLLFLLVGGYAYGAVPLALTGIASSLSARSGSSFGALLLVSAVTGFLFTGLVAGSAALFLWSVTGWQIVLGLAATGAVAGAGAALTLGLLSLLLRHRREDLPA